MSILLLALGLAIAAGINPCFSLLTRNAGKFVAGWAVRSAVLFPVYAALIYLTTPAMVGPFYGLFWLWFLPFAANVGITFGIAAVENDRRRYRGAKSDTSNFPTGGILVGAVALLVGLCVCVYASRIMSLGDYRDMIGEIEETTWEGNLPTADAKHIRMVSDEMARKKAGDVLKELGSSFEIGTMSIQRVNGRLVFVGDLAYLGFFQWKNNDYAPGFVTVDAEDALKPARRHDGANELQKIVYSPSAYFSKNLNRHLWRNGYHNYRLEDETLELNDEFQARWVVTALQPTIAHTADEVKLVLVVHPETGEIKPYEPKDAPAWIDRIYPERLFEERLDWKGKFVNGFWPSVGIGRKAGMFRSTSETGIWLTWSKDERAQWFTGSTSVSNTDDSLVAIYQMDSRTGKVSRFTLPGAPKNEVEIIGKADRMVSNYSNWGCDNVILYEAEGTPTWIGPITSGGEYQTLAFVHYELDIKSNAKDKLSALRAYQSALAKDNTAAPGAQAEAVELELEVVEIAEDVREGRKVWLFKVTDPEYAGKVFFGDTNLSPEIAFLKVGDKVKVTCIVTKRQEVRLSAFDALNQPNN